MRGQLYSLTATLLLFTHAANGLPVIASSSIFQGALLLPVLLSTLPASARRKFIITLGGLLAVITGLAIIVNADRLDGIRALQKAPSTEIPSSPSPEYVSSEKLSALYRSNGQETTVVVVFAADTPGIDGLNHFSYSDIDGIRRYIAADQRKSHAIVVTSTSLKALAFVHEHLGHTDALFAPIKPLGGYIADGHAYSKQVPDENPDVISFIDPGFQYEFPMLGAIQYDWVTSMFMSDSDIESNLSRWRKSDSAIIVVNDSVATHHPNPHIDRLARILGYRSVAVLNKDKFLGRASIPNHHFYYDNYYQPYAVSAALKVDPTALLVCMTKRCAADIPTGVRHDIDPSKLYELRNNRMEPTSGFDAVIDSLKESKTVIFVSDGAYETFMASALAARLQKVANSIIGFTSATSRLFPSQFESRSSQGINKENESAFAVMASEGLQRVARAVRQDSYASSLLMIIGISALSVLLTRALSGGLLLSTIALLFFYHSRYDILHIPPDQYTANLHPLYAIPIIVVGVVTASGLRGTKYAASVAAIILSSVAWVSVADSVTYTLSLCLCFFFGLAALQAKLPRQLQAPCDTRITLGPKADQTIPMTPRLMRGRIYSPASGKLNYPPFTLWPWHIIRSNHFHPDETGAAGVFESDRTTIRNYVRSIERAYRRDLEQLHPARIQYWIQPWIPFSKTGVAQSHNDENPAYYDFALGKPLEVTEGTGGGYSRAPRSGNAPFSLQWRIARMLSKAESTTMGPVIIEFGLLLGVPVCLQIRKAADPAFHSPALLEMIRATNKAPVPIGVSKFANQNSELIQNIFHNTLYRVGSQWFALAQKLNPKPIMQLEMTRWLLELDEMSESEVVSYSKVAEMGRELFSLKTRNRSAKDLLGPSLITTICNRYNETFSEELNASDLVTTSDVHHVCIAILLQLPVTHQMSDKPEPHWHTNEVCAPSNSATNRWEVVPGNFDGRPYYLSSNRDFDEDMSDAILIAKTVPLALFKDLYRFKGIICEEGSPLSHLALFCRQKRIPCRIGSGWIQNA